MMTPHLSCEDFYILRNLVQYYDKSWESTQAFLKTQWLMYPLYLYVCGNKGNWLQRVGCNNELKYSRRTPGKFTRKYKNVPGLNFCLGYREKVC